MNVSTIYVDAREMQTLAKLAADSGVHAGTALMQNVRRAIVVREGDLPTTYVRLNSIVEYVDLLAGLTHWVRIVPPDEVDRAGRVSVLSPVGAALLGRTPGASVGCTLADGKPRVLRIEKVTNSRH